jgi:hypothetical protein
MSNKQVNIKENVMMKIHENKITMKPRSFFVLGSILTIVGLIASVVSSVFLISLISFLLKEHGPMGDYRLSLMLNSFPWWIPILAVAGLVLGIWFLFKYDFLYKINYLFVIFTFIAVVIIAGIIIDRTGVDNLLLNQGPMRGIMRQYIQNENPQINPGNNTNNPLRGRGRFN